jgi:hypothetical protein
MSDPELQPSLVQRPVTEVFDALRERSLAERAPMHVFGHGTLQDDPENFFRDGLVMFNPIKGNYEGIDEMTLQLDLDDQPGTDALLKDWPHLHAPNVLLLAVSAPGEGLNESQKHWYFDGMIQRSGKVRETIAGQEEASHIPTDWVLGMYNADSGLVTLNPAFTGRQVTQEDFSNSAGGNYTHHQRMQEIVEKHGLAGLMPDGIEEITDEPRPVPVSFDHDDDDLPDVW